MLVMLAKQHNIKLNEHTANGIIFIIKNYISTRKLSIHIAKLKHFSIAQIAIPLKHKTTNKKQY